MEEELKQLQERVSRLEQQLMRQNALMDNFSKRIVFNKEVQFKANVYDANGAVVTEINNL